MDMNEKDSIERFTEGLKKAADRARELGRAQKSKHWMQVANGLDGIRVKGMQMFRAKALSRTDVLKMLDNFVDNKKTKETAH